MNNTLFERLMLKDTVAEARKLGAIVKQAYVHATTMGAGASKNWEFFYGDFYYHIGGAENAYDAKAKGWEAWIKSKGISA
jgi:hypothetical protein